MEKRSFNLSIVCLVSFVLLLALFTRESRADVHTWYNPNWASGYATTNYNFPYGTSSGQNPFPNYVNQFGSNNCTNFASQVIMAGMVGSTNMNTVFNARNDFDIDASGSGGYKWYLHTFSDHGPAFTGANQLFQYAANNLPSYKGLHFQYIQMVDYTSLQYGDVVFADWENDGIIDHTMIVTRISSSWFDSGWDKVRVTYQGATSSPTGAVSDVSLNWVATTQNQVTGKVAVFYTFRPVDYNPSGL